MTEYDVTEYGAVGDGEAVDTEAIQAAVDACADAGGGRVVVPSGEYLTTPIFLRSDVELHLESGALLQASDDISAYPSVVGRWEGVEQETYAAPLTGRDLENVAITGQGSIDGAGLTWWRAHVHDEQIFKERGLDRQEQYPPPEGTELDYPRPRTIDLYNCEDVLVRDVSITDSPSWTINPIYCENVTVDNVSIESPAYSANTDGITPDSCRNVRIANCHIDVGDDCISIKSGYDEDGRRVGEPCENIVVTNCTMERGHGGVVIGSEMSGDVRNVTVSNCVFDQTDNGLRIKTERGRGGVIENVRATNIVMHDIPGTAFLVTMFYQGQQLESAPVTEGTPTIRDVRYSDVVVDGVENTASIRGLPEMPIEGLELSNVRVKGARNGFEATTVSDLHLQNVIVDSERGPAFEIADVADLELRRVADPDPDTDVPVVRLDDVDAVVRSCSAADGTGTFIEHGAGDTVAMIDNHLERADRETASAD